MPATQGQAANHSAATQRAPQEPARGQAGSKVVARCPHPWGGARHHEALSVTVPHGIKRKLREEYQPVPILQDFLTASVRESEPNLGRCVADSEEGTILIGAVPGKSAICARAQ